MGLYDEYGEDPSVQLKVGPCFMYHYDIGDPVAIEDGIYVGWGGFVIIVDQALFATYATLKTSHGETITAECIMAGHNSLKKAVGALERAYGRNDTYPK